MMCNVCCAVSSTHSSTHVPLLQAQADAETLEGLTAWAYTSCSSYCAASPTTWTQFLLVVMSFRTCTKDAEAMLRWSFGALSAEPAGSSVAGWQTLHINLVRQGCCLHTGLAQPCLAALCQDAWALQVGGSLQQVLHRALCDLQGRQQAPMSWAAPATRGSWQLHELSAVSPAQQGDSYSMCLGNALTACRS